MFLKNFNEIFKQVERLQGRIHGHEGALANASQSINNTEKTFQEALGFLEGYTKVHSLHNRLLHPPDYSTSNATTDIFGTISVIPSAVIFAL